MNLSSLTTLSNNTCCLHVTADVKNIVLPSKNIDFSTHQRNKHHMDSLITIKHNKLNIIQNPLSQIAVLPRMPYVCKGQNPPFYKGASSYNPLFQNVTPAQNTKDSTQDVLPNQLLKQRILGRNPSQNQGFQVGKQFKVEVPRQEFL